MRLKRSPLLLLGLLTTAVATGTVAPSGGSVSSTRSESTPAGRVVWVSSSGSTRGDALVLSWLDGRRIRVLRAPQPGRTYSGPLWSPDGRTIAVSTSSHGSAASSVVIDARGRQLAVLGAGRTVPNSWAAGGKQLALAPALSECRPPAHAHQLWLRIVSSSGRTRALIAMLDTGDLKRASYDIVDALSWAPDGHALAYRIVHWSSDCDFRGAVEPSGSSVYVVDAHGRHRTVLQRTVGNVGLAGPPAWSPDSSEIAFVDACYRDFPSCIRAVLVKADGSERRILKPAPVLSDSVIWSESGDQLYFGTANEGTGDPLGLLAFPASGGTPQWLVHGCNVGPESSLKLSRDRSKLLAVAGGYGGTCNRLVDLTSGRAWRVTIPSSNADVVIP